MAVWRMTGGTKGAGRYFSSPVLAGVSELSAAGLVSAGVLDGVVFDSGIFVSGALAGVFDSGVFAAPIPLPFLSSAFALPVLESALSAGVVVVVPDFAEPSPPVCAWLPTYLMMSMVETTQTM